MQPRRDEHQRLRNLPLFSGCSEEELEEVDRLADTVSVPAGRVIIRQGDLGQEFALILAGEVAVERDGVAVAELGPGHWFGEVALLDSVPRSASVVARTDVELEVLDRRAFNTLLDDLPRLSRSLLRFLAHRLTETEEELHRLQAERSGS